MVHTRLFDSATGRSAGEIDIPEEIIAAASKVATWLRNVGGTHLGHLTLRDLPNKPGKQAATQEAAWPLQETFEGKPHGWIQWKGTNACMDIYCACGHHSHIDAEFAYSIECRACHRVYMTNGHIELIELAERPQTRIVMDERDIVER